MYMYINIHMCVIHFELSVDISSFGFIINPFLSPDLTIPLNKQNHLIIEFVHFANHKTFDFVTLE